MDTTLDSMLPIYKDEDLEEQELLNELKSLQQEHSAEQDFE